MIETLKELMSPAHLNSLDESVAEESLGQTATNSAESEEPQLEKRELSDEPAHQEVSTSTQIVEASCQEDMHGVRVRLPIS